MPLSLPSNVADRQNSFYQSRFSKRTIDNAGSLSLGRPPKQALPPIPPSPSRRASYSKTAYIKRRTKQRERELIEIQKITLQAPPPKGALTLPTFQWIRGTMIGKGSQGKVYMALNVTTGGIMAVKQVERPGPLADGDGLERIADALREEQETLRDLNHPSVVQYLGFEENHQTLNIFLEYVSGGTIDSCVKTSGKLREDVTKHFTRQILEGLAYLHSEGILHRDLKAANILVMDSGACKISDFGISKRNLRAFSFTGTSYCMAPETLSPGTHGYDAKVDIWSVGCVVQQMWTGTRAWLNVDFLTVWYRLGEGELPPLPSDISLSMLAHHFRQECFQIAPDRRPSAEFLLLHPYLELPPDWEFPGMRSIGSAPNAVCPISGMRQRQNPDTHAPASVFHDMQVVALGSPSHCTGANESSGFLPIEHQPSSPRPLPSPPSYSTNPRPLPTPPPSPAPSRLRSKASSSSMASVSSTSTLGIYCDPPRPLSSKITTIPESDDAGSQTTLFSRSSSKSPSPFRYTPPPLPHPQFPYSSHLLPPPKYIDARSRYPEALLRKTESNPEISQYRPLDTVVNRIQRAHSTSTAESKPGPAMAIQAAQEKPRPRLSKPLPLPPSPTPSPSPSFLSSCPQTSPRPLPNPRIPSPSSSYDDSHLSYTSSLGSTWQKPPRSLTTPRSPSDIIASFPSPPSSPAFVKATTRPGIREVVEKLDDYFPEHNLDAPVVMENNGDSPTADSFLPPLDSSFFEEMGIYDPGEIEEEIRRLSVETRRSRKRTMKSIKSIAEENVLEQLNDSTSSRRQTMCWDSRVEEIKVPW